MQLLTMSAGPKRKSLQQRAFRARLKRLKALDAAIAQAMRALSDTASTVEPWMMPSVKNPLDDPKGRPPVLHWPVVHFQRKGPIRHVILRYDGVLVQAVTSYALPLGWTVPIDLSQLSLRQLDRVIRELKAIGKGA